MKALNLMIKPSSGNCNMRCSYCFYADVISNRETKSYGYMSTDTLRTIVKKVLQEVEYECGFIFQGGEPTLVGLEFYQKLIDYVNEFKNQKQKISYYIQTNGYIIDDQWAEFFHRHNFLVGLSLDGNKDTNDRYRIDAQNKGCYKTIMKTAALFKKHKVEFNILTVITKPIAKNIGKIYGFYKRNGFQYQQYIPCLEPFGEEKGGYEFSLTSKLYTEFLKNLFDLYYNDMIKGEFVYNRYFENLIGMISGYPPETCTLKGVCSPQYIVEADGSVYPCDFYVLDEYRIGNLAEDSFETIEENRRNSDFIQCSAERSEECNNCKWFRLCMGGCRRDRETTRGLGQNYYCESYKEFFEYSYSRLRELAVKYKKA